MPVAETPPPLPMKPVPAWKEEVGFVPFQPMVNWFTPAELIRAGVKAVLSGLFGAYADKREVQALQGAPQLFSFVPDPVAPAPVAPAPAAPGPSVEVVDLSGPTPNGFWLDYIADLGDGFDATYTMAALLAQDTLSVPHGADTRTTERGRVLLMGGDQVYPTATRDEYRNRLIGPYEAALPNRWKNPSGDGTGPPAEAGVQPSLFSIPGNHDWYDGLTSFTRLFCQKRTLGAWKTHQRRSYFALKLPHGWWLWGIDVQLGSDIDQPQLAYFDALASDPTVMPAGSKIILCSAEPSWMYHHLHGPASYHNLKFFERTLIRAHHHELVVGLAGDLHAYARYAADDGRQRFVSGGGGAYLYPTHRFPETLTLPDAATDTSTDFSLTSSDDDTPHLFPDASRSRRLASGSFLFPFRNVRFSAFLGAFYLFFAWIAQSTSLSASSDSFLHDLAGSEGMRASLLDALAALWDVMQHSPFAMFLILLLLGGLIGFADTKKTGLKVLLGTLHTLLHVFFALLLMWGFIQFNLYVIGLSDINNWQILLFAGEMLVFGSFVGGIVMGLYLYLAHLIPDVHTNEVFLCQSIPDYKHFLRLHIGDDGALTIYPIGVPRVCRRWMYAKPTPGVARTAPLFQPEEGETPLAERAVLIEAPIRVTWPAPDTPPPVPAPAASVAQSTAHP